MAGVVITGTNTAETAEYKEVMNTIPRKEVVHVATVEWVTHRGDQYHEPQTIELVVGNVVTIYKAVDQKRF